MPRATPIKVPCGANIELEFGKLYEVTSKNYPELYPHNHQ